MSEDFIPKGNKCGKNISEVGVILVLLGVFIFVKRYYPEISFHYLLPYILVVSGIIMIVVKAINQKR